MLRVTFQRARSEEQRAARRRAILGTAEAMLAEMPVAALSLNELSRRVGLAKSNVLRYFESREAVLLELLDAAWREWLDALADALPPGDPAVPVDERVEQVAALLARTLVGPSDALRAGQRVRPRCWSATSPSRSPRGSSAPRSPTRSRSGRWSASVVPELGEAAAQRFAGATVLVAGSLWAYSRPSAAMLAAYEADPALAAMRLDFCDAVRDLLATLLAGLLARPA